MNYCQPYLMHKVAIITFLILNAAVSASAQWTALPSGTTEHLHKIAFRNAAVGYCVGGGDTYGYPVPGAKGVVLRTADGSASWTTVVQDSTMGFSELAVLGDTVYAYGRTQMDAVVARSTDNGLTWTVATTTDFRQDVKTFGNALYFSDGLNIKRTIGSITSNVCPAHTVYDVNAFGIYVLGTGTVLNYFVAQSQDVGATWDTSYITPNPFSPSPFTHAAVKAFGDTIIACATYPGTVAYSYNNGATWNAHPPDAPYNCFISSPRVITGISSSDWIVRSNNGGQTWIVQDTLPHAIRQFHFLNEDLGYVCGLNGMIYKTTNGGGNPATTVSGPTASAREIKLYPNPAKASLTISGDFEKGSSLSVFNQAGQRLLTALIEGRNATLNVGYLPAGIYQIVVTEKDKPVAMKQWVKQ